MGWGVEGDVAVSADVVKVTVPAGILPLAVVLNGTFAKSVVPSMNETVPVGVPVVVLTEAVKVTERPEMDGLADEVTVVVVMALVPEL